MQQREIIPFPKTSPNSLSWKIFIKKWHQDIRVGIYPEEISSPQTVEITLECDVKHPKPKDAQSIDEIVCYETLRQKIQHKITEQHFYLLETVCEEIVAVCFEDPRIAKVTTRVEKTAKDPSGLCFGVEITRESN